MATTVQTYKRPFFLASFSLLVSFLVIIMAVTLWVQKEYYYEMNAAKTEGLSAAVWGIKNIEPNPEKPGIITLNLESSIGNIRRYPGVRSFGISSNGRKLAISTDSNFLIIDLEDNAEQALLLPFSYSGDRGEAISWSYDDSQISLIVQSTEDNLSYLVVLNSNGELISKTVDDFTYRMVNGEKTFFPAKYSPTQGLILTRTFTDKSSIAELDPASLKVFNPAGTVRKEIEVRDRVGKIDNIVYTWSRDGESVLYRIAKVGTEIDYSKEYQFNRTIVGFN